MLKLYITVKKMNFPLGINKVCLLLIHSARSFNFYDVEIYLLGSEMDWSLGIHMQIEFLGHTVASCNLVTPCFERISALLTRLELQ